MKISISELKEIIQQEIDSLAEGYYSKGKCVYKKKDNSKVGCTDGPVKDYLAALYANVGDAKESKLKEGIEQLTPENIESLFSAMKEMATKPEIVKALGDDGLVGAIDKMKDSFMKKTSTGTSEPTMPASTLPAKEMDQ
tara:strand:- start:181 stop:597 length:417 start_codon:yes stop_codon:yes gene_type:complete